MSGLDKKYVEALQELISIAEDFRNRALAAEAKLERIKALNKNGNYFEPYQVLEILDEENPMTNPLDIAMGERT